MSVCSFGAVASHVNRKLVEDWWTQPSAKWSEILSITLNFALDFPVNGEHDKIDRRRCSIGEVS